MLNRVIVSINTSIAYFTVVNSKQVTSFSSRFIDIANGMQMGRLFSGASRFVWPSRHTIVVRFHFLRTVLNIRNGRVISDLVLKVNLQIYICDECIMSSKFDLHLDIQHICYLLLKCKYARANAQKIRSFLSFDSSILATLSLITCFHR